MKKTILQVLACLLFLCLVAVSCQDEERARPQAVDESEIAAIEKREGITMFKKTFEFKQGENHAVLTVATRKQEIFTNIIENLKLDITPVLKGQQLDSKNHDGSGSRGELIAGEEILTEYTIMQRDKNVVGFATTIRLDEKVLSSGRPSALSGYSAYVTHYSNVWPSRFWVDLPASGIGVYFQKQTRWYSGWESDGNHLVECSCGSEPLNVTRVQWDLFGSCFYRWHVDGPYKSRAQIGYFIPGSDGWTFGYDY